MCQSPGFATQRPVPGRNLFFKPEVDNGNIAIVTPQREQVGIAWFRQTGKYTVETEHLSIDDAYQNTGLFQRERVC